MTTYRQSPHPDTLNYLVGFARISQLVWDPEKGPGALDLSLVPYPFAATPNGIYLDVDDVSFEDSGNVSFREFVFCVGDEKARLTTCPVSHDDQLFPRHLFTSSVSIPSLHRAGKRRRDEGERKPPAKWGVENYDSEI